MKTKVSKTEKNQAEIDFFLPVEKVSVASLVGNNKETYQTLGYNSHAVIVSKEDNTQLIVGFCSEGYGLLPNYSFFPVFENDLSKSFSFDKEYKHKEFAKYYADYFVKDSSILIEGVKDTVLSPSIKIYHSYNGQLGFKVTFGVRNEKTQSTLFGLSQVLEAVHTDELMSGITDESIAALHEFLESLPEVKAIYDKMATTTVGKNWKAKFEELVQGAGVLKSFTENMLEWMSNSSQKVTYWLFYNAFAYQLNHNPDILAPDEAKIIMDKKVFNYITKNYL